MNIAIVNYNAGNTRSVANAFERLGQQVEITDNPETIRHADRVVFPGQGEASTAIKHLKAKGLDEVLKRLQQPFLGICLGLQLMCKHSEEQDTEGLGIFDASVKRFPAGLKIPQMGWNNFTKLQGDLFKGITKEDDAYFVHSYYAELSNDTCGVSEYGIPFSSALRKNNYYAVQFHPEKSGTVGETILRNFLK